MFANSYQIFTGRKPVRTIKKEEILLAVNAELSSYDVEHLAGFRGK